MKKAIVFLVAIVAVISMSSTVTQAFSDYRDDVNTTCGTSYGCNFCHDNANKQAYKDNGACGFCPTAQNCGGTPPPAPTCTDFDGDGFFLEPGCGQLYDCVDRNSSIYPGATEICNDGIDQDCSGADKKKGRGCRQRK